MKPYSDEHLLVHLLANANVISYLVMFILIILGYFTMSSLFFSCYRRLNEYIQKIIITRIGVFAQGQIL